MDSREKSKFLSSLLGQCRAHSFLLPEYDLLATILASGICEAAGHNLGDSRSSYKKRKIMQVEAQAWINSDEIFIDEKSGISFSYICEALSVDRNVIRTALNGNKIPKTFSTHFRNREQKRRQSKIN